ncbi:tRNA (adenine22-N1)-methyltransferase [Ruminococcaceae bacterium YRB3002]|nr:tRNA (adenine22-N1)-methyltransferase [Ruminococcaceae bacterium YRB3002]
MNRDLPARLKTIAGMASLHAKGRRVIDVGSDHGLLSIYLLKNGLFEKAVLTDINEGPAARSEGAIRANLLSDRAEVLCTDGLAGVSVGPDDTIVMAGMGGLNIRDIITRYRDTVSDIPSDVRFILQPQKSLPELREWLSLEGFEIEDEDAVEEGGFFYCILCVKYTGGCVTLTDRELYYGPVMLGRFDERPEYKAFLDRVFAVRSRSDNRLARVLEEMK